jgi:hypothetical protein
MKKPKIAPIWRREFLCGPWNAGACTPSFIRGEAHGKRIGVTQSCGLGCLVSILIFFGASYIIKNEDQPAASKTSVVTPPPAPVPHEAPPAFPTDERIWKAADGRQITARATAFDGATVTLLRADGIEFPAVAIETLSDADQAFLRTLKPPGQ